MKIGVVEAWDQVPQIEGTVCRRARPPIDNASHEARRLGGHPRCDAELRCLEGATRCQGSRPPKECWQKIEEKGEAQNAHVSPAVPRSSGGGRASGG